MPIDLRSDTVTRPDAGMRRAMAEAEVGDDVLGDDPTVLALQDRVAKLLGKPAALFTPSGTMANQLGIASHVRPGDEVLIDRASHALNYEAGASAALSGIQYRELSSPPNGFRVEDLEPAVRTSEYWLPRTRAVVVENTHNGRGGEIYALERLRAVHAWAERTGLRVHMDGARLWNASAASGIPVHEYAACAHTVSVCFSKGLGAPVGSMLAGAEDAVRDAKRLRRRWGGAMRQSGVLAAAALYGLDHNLLRLAADHAKAQRLYDAVRRCAGLEVERPPETNILIVTVTGAGDSPERLVEDLAREGVRASRWSATQVRFVTHLDASAEDVGRAAEILIRLRGA